MVRRYFINVAIAVDQLFNALLGGDLDETLSSRAAKLAKAGLRWPARLIDLLLGRGHCEQAQEPDEGEDSIINIEGRREWLKKGNIVTKKRRKASGKRNIECGKAIRQTVQGRGKQPSGLFW